MTQTLTTREMNGDFNQKDNFTEDFPSLNNDDNQWKVVHKKQKKKENLADQKEKSNIPLPNASTISVTVNNQSDTPSIKVPTTTNTSQIPMSTITNKNAVSSPLINANRLVSTNPVNTSQITNTNNNKNSSNNNNYTIQPVQATIVTSVPSASKTIPCKFYRVGTCASGDKCRFSHAGNNNNTGSSQAGGTSFCKFFAAGNCRNGSSCLYTHEIPNNSTANNASTKRVPPISNNENYENYENGFVSPLNSPQTKTDNNIVTNITSNTVSNKQNTIENHTSTPTIQLPLPIPTQQSLPHIATSTINNDPNYDNSTYTNIPNYSNYYDAFYQDQQRFLAPEQADYLQQMLLHQNSQQSQAQQHTMYNDYFAQYVPVYMHDANSVPLQPTPERQMDDEKMHQYYFNLQQQQQQQRFLYQPQFAEYYAMMNNRMDPAYNDQNDSTTSYAPQVSMNGPTSSVSSLFSTPSTPFENSVIPGAQWNPQYHPMQENNFYNGAVNPNNNFYYSGATSSYSTQLLDNNETDTTKLNPENTKNSPRDSTSKPTKSYAEIAQQNLKKQSNNNQGGPSATKKQNTTVVNNNMSKVMEEWPGTTPIMTLPANSDKICPYYMQGNCMYGDDCRLMHGLACPSCGKAVLPIDDNEEAEKHIEECKERKQVQKEREQSINCECGICFENIVDKKRKFGLLLGCEHSFCLECIREWRTNSTTKLSNTTVRSCPICRMQSHFVLPSDRWVTDAARKDHMAVSYRQKLATIPCKYYNMGQSTCPFGTSCFYQHINKDGTAPKATVRKYVDADGVVEFMKTVRLSDFLEDQLEQQLQESDD